MSRYGLKDPSVDYVYNVILVGKFGAGKTTLMTTATLKPGEEAPQPAENSSEDTANIGMDFRVLRQKLDDCTVELKIFDTGNMERFRNDLTSTYYRHAHLALLVFDVTDSSSFEALRVDWFEDTKNYAPETCMKVVVANKIDLGRRACEEGLAEAWASHHGMDYLEVSATNRSSVATLFTRLAEKLRGKGKPATQATIGLAHPGQPEKKPCCGN